MPVEKDASNGMEKVVIKNQQVWKRLNKAAAVQSLPPMQCPTTASVLLFLHRATAQMCISMEPTWSAGGTLRARWGDGLTDCLPNCIHPAE